MTISTRAELKTALTTWLVRSDLISLYDDFITLAEIELNSKLRLLQQEAGPTSVSLSQAATTATLPTRFLDLISLRWNDIDGGPEQRTLDQIAAMSTTGSGRPSNFAVSAAFVFDRPADQAYTLKSRHFEKWSLGTQTTDTNWLLTNAPDAYLYACLAVAADYARNLKDPATLWIAKREDAIQRLNRLDAKARRSAPLTSDVALLSRRGSGYDITTG